jgi:FkbM family methyltransferase
VWFKFFKKFSGLTLRSHLNLIFSAIVDLLMVLLFPRSMLWNPRTLWSSLYVVKHHNFIIFTRGGTEDLYHALPRREPLVYDLMLSILKKDDVFVDVGANIGYYTILAAKLGAHVIAVEPVPETAKVLMLNLKINGVKNVLVVQKAAWDKREKLLINIPKGFYGCASVYKRYSLQTIKMMVEGFPLDDIFRDHPCNIKLIKIDVEGAEYRVIKGAGGVLLNTMYVVIAPHYEVGSLSWRKILDCLTQKGFSIEWRQGYMICQNKSLLPV